MKKLREEIRRLKKHHVDYYLSLCDVAEKYIDEKPDITIETCKSIIEGISKLTIHLLKQEPIHRLNSSDFDQLFKDALKAIDQKSDRNFSFDKDAVNRFGSAIHHLGRIRNHHGDISHGRASLKHQTNDADLAELIIGFTDSIGTYMLRKLEQLGHFASDEGIEYDTNEDFNYALDESYPIEGNLSFSRALFDQDPVRYREWRDEWYAEFLLDLP